MKGSELSPWELQPCPSSPGVRARHCSLPGGEGSSPADAQRGRGPAAGWHPPSSHSRTKSRNPIWTCFIQHREVRHVQAYMCVHDTPRHTQTHACARVHTCAFSPLSKDSWILAAAVQVQTQRGSGGKERPGRAQTAASHFPLLQSTLLHHTQNRRSLLHGSGSTTGDKAHSCVTTAHEDQGSLSPRVRPGAHLGQVESGVTPSAPHISAATPEPHGNGTTGAGAQQQGCPRPGTVVCLTYNVVPVSVQRSDSAVHTLTSFPYIRPIMVHPRRRDTVPCAPQQDLVVYPV